ncbi:MAG: hypothetical protein WB543_17065 [Candidatus Acidiferrum sp.]
MIPHAATLQPVPLTLQVTAVFEVPVTVAANCCVDPTASVALFGLTCTATPAAAATFKVALVLFALPALLVTTTAKSSRLSEVVVGGVVYVEEVAPLIAAAFFRHW